MGEKGPGVQHSRWEIAGWTILACAAGLDLATASSAWEVAGGVALVALLIGTLAWSRRIRRTRSLPLAQRMPLELRWLVGAAALFIGAGVVVESQFEEKIFSGLLAIALLTFLISERTSELPSEPSTAQPAAKRRGITRISDRALYVAVASIGIAIVGLWIASFAAKSSVFLLAAWLAFGPVGYLLGELHDRRDARKDLAIK